MRIPFGEGHNAKYTGNYKGKSKYGDPSVQDDSQNGLVMLRVRRG
jgi:hypothetical protein